MDEVTIEHFFTHKGSGAISVYQVHTLVNVELLRAGYPAGLYVAPSSLKKLFAGSGNADKDEMGAAILESYGESFEDDDQADAFCLAICARDHYLWKRHRVPVPPTIAWSAYHQETMKGWKRSF